MIEMYVLFPLSDETQILVDNKDFKLIVSSGLKSVFTFNTTDVQTDIVIPIACFHGSFIQTNRSSL